MKNDLLITREQFFNFIKNKRDTEEKLSSSTQHYLDYFDKHQISNKKSNWNWGGLVPCWIFYRRMYLNGLYFICFDRCLSMLAPWFNYRLSSNFIGDVIVVCLDIIVITVLMRYGDYIYLNHANKKIAKGIIKGGTNMPILIICYTLTIVAIYLYGGK